MKKLLLGGIWVLGMTLSAQDLRVELKYQETPQTTLEGFLVVTSPAGEPAFLPGQPEEDKNGLKRISWTTEPGETGIMKFYLSNTQANGEFSDWSGNRWLDYTELHVTFKERTWTLKPPSGAGAVWYAFDFICESGDLMPIDVIAPRSGALFGHVAEATSGLGLPSFPVIRRGEKGEDRDRTTAQGLYLFFPEDQKSTLKFDKPGYISVEEPLNHPRLDIPLRIDVPLTPELEENTWRVVLSWMYYPEDLDLTLAGVLEGGEPFTISEREKRSFKGWARLDLSGRRGFDSETLTINKLEGAPYQVQVRIPLPQEKEFRLSYSQAKVRVFKGKKLLNTFQVPAGKPGNLWEVCRIERDGGVVEVGKLGSNP